MAYLAKNVVSIFLLVGNISLIHAQRVELGIKVGGALTTVEGPHLLILPRTEMLTGFVGGFYKVLPLSRHGRLALQPELLFSMQGYKLTNPDTQYEAIMRSYYATVPVLATYSYKQFFVAMGPQIGYLTGVYERYTISRPQSSTGPTYTNTVTTPAGYPRWDVAGVVSGGYRLPSGPGIELRYVRGFSGLYYSSAGEHHVGYQLQASYPLRLRK